MLSSILGVVYFIIAISIIVVVHEWGHMVVAKRNGVKCFEFSVGMGPVLKRIGTDNDGTVYNIRWIPLGGFVAMAGEEEMSDIEFSPEQSLMNKKPWQKIKILFAGAGMNFILGALVLFITYFVFGLNVVSAGNAVTVADGGVAATAGMETGDRIISIDGNDVNSYEEISAELDQTESPEITYLDKSTNAEVSVNLQKVALNCDQSVIGILPVYEKQHLQLFESLKATITSFVTMFTSVGQSLALLVNGTAGVSDLMGPIGIASASSSVVTGGIQTMLLTIAFLSINIGIVNLLPFPALDGGRMVLAFYELIFRRRVNEKLELYLNLIGFLLLMGLFVIVTFSDVSRLGDKTYFDMQIESSTVCARDEEQIEYKLILEPIDDNAMPESVVLDMSISSGKIVSIGEAEINDSSAEITLTTDEYKKIISQGIDIVIDNDTTVSSPLDLSLKVKDEKNDIINQVIYRIEK